MPDHGSHGPVELDLFSWGAGEREPVPEPLPQVPQIPPAAPVGEAVDDDTPIYPAPVPPPEAAAVAVAEPAAPTNGAYTGGTGVDALDAVQGHLLPDLAVATSSLAARLIVPPFSVLDTQQPYWQQRKRAWVGLGIKSELGRGDDLLATGTGSVYNGSAGYANAAVKDSSGAGTATSIFDPVLCEVAYRWWCPEGGVVLDPFAGGSVRGAVAAVLGRGYLGVDLRAEQVLANAANWEEVLAASASTAPPPLWQQGDSTKLSALLGPAATSQAFDMLFTCPPYFNLEVYSDDPSDLSNAKDWDRFCVLYRQVIADALGYLKPNRFSVWVVGNLRDGKGRVLDLAGQTVRIHEQLGAQLYNDLILMTAIGTLPMRTAAQFPRGRKVGRRHQQVLVFYKGDPSTVKDALGPVQGWVPSSLTGGDE